MGTILLEIFLAIQVFVVGVLAVLIWQHAREHYKPKAPEPPPLPALNMTLSPEIEAHFRQAAEQEFREVLNRGAVQLQRDLGMTSEQVNNLVSRLASTIVAEELERYRQELAKLHQQTATDLGGIKNEVAKHQAEIKAKVAQEFAAEQQRLIKQIDTKLADAVASFLLETLQHEVDLGGQTAYLVAVLEEHKNDFKQEVGDDTPVA